jgi:hypothetical protein
MKTKGTKKKTAKSSAADYLKRLGPVREVVKMVKAHDTEGSYNLHLSCKHVRVGTKRKSLRCGRCRSAK